MGDITAHVHRTPMIVTRGTRGHVVTIGAVLVALSRRGRFVDVALTFDGGEMVRAPSDWMTGGFDRAPRASRARMR